jgi:hypothetical protein
VWAWFCRRYGCELRLHPRQCLVPSPEQIDAAEIKVMVYLHVLRQGYAYSTIRSYFADLKHLQRTYHNGLPLDALHQTFHRCNRLLRVFEKEMPVVRQKKRPWLPQYFHHVAVGRGWRPTTYGKEWAPFLDRVVWTVMVFMFEHLLRLGEVVQTAVPRQAARRPWTQASVAFFSGDREIGWTANGAPDPAWRCQCTHAVIESAPSKTDVMGDKFDPFVCPFPCEADVLVASKGDVNKAAGAWIFATGPLLWDMMTRDPVPRALVAVTPLFREAAKVPPAVVRQLGQARFVSVFNVFCRTALPRVPAELNGKRLGGHCMRVAGCNHAAKLNASIVQIANKGRWGAWAFSVAKGYDYFRTDSQSMDQLTTAMILELLSLRGAG